MSLDHQNLSRKLNVIFALFFLGPVAGILYLVWAYNIFEDRLLPMVLLVLLVFAYFGYNILRTLFDNLARLSQSLTQSLGTTVGENDDEIGNIVQAVTNLENSLTRNFQALNKKVSDITALKELSELCYITFDAEDLFYLTLERALNLVNAEIGSVLLVERPGREFFIVQASVGLDEYGQRGRKVPFQTSIAKYAVINKAPLRVEDIEEDTRFSRRSRPKYGTHSFLIMPLRTMREVLGVITFAKKRDGSAFTQDDVDLLTPLLSTAAFTYDNLALDNALKKSSKLLDTVRKIVFLLASNMKPNEVLHGVLEEIRSLVPFDEGLILTVDPDHPDDLVVDLGHGTAHHYQVMRAKRYPYLGTIFDRVLRSDTGCDIEIAKDLTQEVEREIVDHSGLRFAHVEPLKVQGRSAGMLVVGTTHDMPFPAEKREQLRILAGFLSLAVEKLRLLTAVDLGKRELDTLNRVGSALASSTFAADKVLEYTLDLVSASTHAEAGCILMREGDELAFRAAFQLDLEVLKNTHLKMGQGLAGYCAARGEPVVLGQQRDPIHLTPAVDAITGFVTRNGLAVPLIAQGKVIGVIEVLNKMGGEFSDRETKLLQSIAGSVSIALENARLYQQIVADAENERAIRNVFQKFVPKVVVDKIVQGAETEGGVDEFKRITLLNIDIRSFSKLAKRVGPHRSVALLNEFFATMGSIVVRHGGIVDKYLGDGFLALFGAPVSTAHDADHAIVAALLMRHALGQLNQKIAAEYGGELSVGIAIHTGEVIVGNIGFEKKMDYTVIGDSVNAVFRLQALTRDYPNGILITAPTRRASMSFLKLKPAGAHDIDATGGPLEIFEVLGIKSQSSAPQATDATTKATTESQATLTPSDDQPATTP